MKKKKKTYYCGPYYMPHFLKRFTSGSFNEACRMHDEDYDNKIGQKKADKKFLKEMKKKAGWNPILQLKAHGMYRLVRMFGKHSY